jgi:hypothetical protein
MTAARGQQRAHDPADLRIALIDQFPDPGFELAGRDLADLEPECLEHATDVIVEVDPRT